MYQRAERVTGTHAGRVAECATEREGVMATLFEMPCCAAGETVYNAATKVTGAGQSVAYDYASTLADQPGDVVFGMNNTNANYLNIPLSLGGGSVIRSRQYIDPTALTFGADDQFNINYFRGTSFSNRTHRLYIGNVSSVFGVAPLSYAEGSTLVTSLFIPITKAAMLVESSFVRSSVFGAFDAVYTVWVNGTQIYQRTSFTNYDSFNLVNQSWFGLAAEGDAGTTGVLKIGKIKIINTDTLIGPYSVPGSGRPYDLDQLLDLTTIRM